MQVVRGYGFPSFITSAAALSASLDLVEQDVAAKASNAAIKVVPNAVFSFISVPPPYISYGNCPRQLYIFCHKPTNQQLIAARRLASPGRVDRYVSDTYLQPPLIQTWCPPR